MPNPAGISTLGELAYDSVSWPDVTQQADKKNSPDQKRECIHRYASPDLFFRQHGEGATTRSSKDGRLEDLSGDL